MPCECHILLSESVTKRPPDGKIVFSDPMTVLGVMALWHMLIVVFSRASASAPTRPFLDRTLPLRSKRTFSKSSR